MYNCKYSKAYLNKGKKFKTSANQLSNQAKKIKYSGFFLLKYPVGNYTIIPHIM